MSVLHCMDAQVVSRLIKKTRTRYAYKHPNCNHTYAAITMMGDMDMRTDIVMELTMEREIAIVMIEIEVVREVEMYIGMAMMMEVKMDVDMMMMMMMQFVDESADTRGHNAHAVGAHMRSHKRTTH